MLTARLILERFDKDHRLLERREQPSRSFVRNFLGLFYVAHAQITAATPYSMNDITNTARTVDNQGYVHLTSRNSKANLRIGAAGGLSGIFCHCGWSMAATGHSVLNETIESEKIGIVVGTGANAVTPTDVALQTRILHGTQAGRFEYGGCELIGIAFADPNGQFTIRRYFTNNSGGSITVNEAGIYSVATDYDDVYAWPFCIARDVVAPGVGVNNTELLRVTYVPQITV